MLLGGLWHGAPRNFVIWGALHGGLLAFERAFGKRPLYFALPTPLRVALTFVILLFTMRRSMSGVRTGYSTGRKSST